MLQVNLINKEIRSTRKKVFIKLNNSLNLIFIIFETFALKKFQI
jgi:hypothetical protein